MRLPLRTRLLPLWLAACAAACAATARAQTRPAATPPNEVTAWLVVFTVDPAADNFAPLFTPDGPAGVKLEAAELKRRAASEIAGRRLRPESRMMTRARVGTPVTLADDPSSDAPARTMQVRLTRSAEDPRAYEVRVDAKGPSGGLRATFSLRPDEAIVYQLPGNFYTTVADGPRRPTYAAFLTLPAPRPEAALAVAYARTPLAERSGTPR